MAGSGSPSDVRRRHALERALSAARRRIAELEEDVARLSGVAPPAPPDPFAAEFWTRQNGRFRRIFASELDWVEAERDYVRLHTAEASFLHSESMSAIEARLDPLAFRRVHRSAIVRWDRTREIRRTPEGALTVVTGLGAQVRVGRTFAPELLAALACH